MNELKRREGQREGQPAVRLVPSRDANADQDAISKPELEPGLDRHNGDLYTGFGVLLCALGMFMLATDPLDWGSMFRKSVAVAGIAQLVIGAALIDRANKRRNGRGR